MYNDGVITTEFTGYYDNVEQEYIYPSAPQSLSIVFNDFFLTAGNGDFTTDGVTISTETGDAEDLTIGNAPSAVLNATMLNPDGLMESLTWGDGSVYIGAVTATAAADTYASLPCHVYVNSIHYGINASGNARRGSTTYTLGGTPLAVIANSDGTDVLFITTTKIGHYNGSFSVVNSPTDAQTFIASHYTDQENPIGIALDSKGCPAVFNDVKGGTKTTYTNIPMGIFDFSNVDAFGMTFNVEAYDKMTVFDADATDWINNLSFSGGKTVPQIIDALVATKFGMSYVISAYAVNTASIKWNANPITSYSVTYRQILKWCAEAIGCNVRISRTGVVVFYVWDTSPVATITPYTIVSNTRTKNRYTVPSINHAICYNALGAGYESGAGSNIYYVVGNPIVDPSGNITILSNILGRVDDVAAYYPTNITVACADPRIDAGDCLAITTPDGNDTYNIPLMRQVLTWHGNCVANYIATGNQTRAIPADMQNTDLSSVVDSNPVSVIKKIQAEGISADWITAGKLTVKDSSNRTIFEADKDTRKAVIGGFTADYNKLVSNGSSYTVTLEDNHIDIINNITNQELYMDTDYVQVMQSGNLFAELASDKLTVEDGDAGNEAILTASDLTLMATDPAKGINYGGYDRTTLMRPFSINHNSGTAQTSYTIDLPPGLYIIVHGDHINPLANAQGMQILAISSKSGTESVVTTLTGSGSHVTATSGTRSQVTVGDSDGSTAELIWTVQGRTYRRLELIRLN